jgi:hypothetical protein
VLFVLREAGVVVDLVHGKPSDWAAPPEVHADQLLERLIVDEDFAGRPAATQALRKFYLLTCRTEGVRPFPCTVGSPPTRTACRQRPKKSTLPTAFRRLQRCKRRWRLDNSQIVPRHQRGS